MIVALRHTQSVAAGAASLANDNFVIRLPSHGTLQHVSSVLSTNASGPVHVDLNIWDESVSAFTWYGHLGSGMLHPCGILAGDAVTWEGSLDLASLIHGKLLPDVVNDGGATVSVLTVAYVENAL